MIIFFSILSFLIIYFIFTYNSLIRARNLVREAASGVDVQLKRRYTLIPNLVETVKGYSSHEKQLFSDISAVRSRSMDIEVLSDKAGTENELTSMLKNLFIVAENYPDLKASKNFLDLQKNLVEIEDQLQYARRYYNGTVRDYNITVESFPANLMAGLFGFKREEFFEIELVTERKAPEVQL